MTSLRTRRPPVGKEKRKALTTDRQVRALKPECDPFEHAIADCKGLRVRVYPSGRKAWLFRSRSRQTSKLQRMTLGEYASDGMSLADARTAANRQRAIADEHGSAKDYRAIERHRSRTSLADEAAATAEAAFTVESLVNKYIEAASDDLKSWREVERALRKYIVPKLGAAPAHSVARADVREVIEGLNESAGPVMANRTLAYFRRAFNWAIAASLPSKERPLETNPCTLIEKKKERSKERYLGQTEIQRFLRNLPTTDIDEVTQDLYRFILLTGLRPGEAAAVGFENIDESEKLLRIEDTKNERTHLLPLSAQAMRIVDHRKGSSRWLFPMKSDEKRHLRGDAIQRPLRKALANLKILPTTPHDLRRTFATGLAGPAVKARRIVISLALNHKVPGATSIYDQHRYLDELRDAVQKWGDHIDVLRGASTSTPADSAA